MTMKEDQIIPMLITLNVISKFYHHKLIYGILIVLS